MDPAPTQEFTDEELDAYIRARLKQAGVDISVLPENDRDAPADQRGILEGARRFLRSTPPAILGFEPDVQLVAPAMYPAALGATLREGRDG
jgi:hypothetical protein